MVKYKRLGFNFFMKTKIIFILILSFISFISYAAKAEELFIEEDDVMDTAVSEATQESVCLKDYRRLKNQFALKSSLGPFVFVGSLAESAALGVGFEYGGWFALKAALGTTGTAVLGTTISHVIPITVMATFLTLEPYYITRFVQASRAYRLLKDVYGIGNGRILEKVSREIIEKNPELTRDQIKDFIISADQNSTLCNGEWVKGFRSKRHKRLISKIALIKDIEREILK
jgi:hypothetical protein